MKQYLISEEELKDIIKKAVGYAPTLLHPENYISNFLKSKQPVEVIAEGEMTYTGLFLEPKVRNILGKKVKLWIEEE